MRLDIGAPGLDLVRHAILDAWFAGEALDREGLDRHLSQVADQSTRAIADALWAGADLARRTLEEASERAGSQGDRSERAEILAAWRQAVTASQAEADLSRDLAEARKGVRAAEAVSTGTAQKEGDASGEADALRRLQDLVRARQNAGKSADEQNLPRQIRISSASGTRPRNQNEEVIGEPAVGRDTKPEAGVQTGIDAPDSPAGPPDESAF